MGDKYTIKDSSGWGIGSVERIPSTGEQIGAGVAGAIVAYNLLTSFGSCLDNKTAERAIKATEIGEYEKAIKEANLLVASKSKDASVYLLRGVIYLHAKKQSEAVVDLTKAIDLDSSLDRAFAERAGCYAKQQDWRKAIRDITSAIQLNPSVHDYWNMRGGYLCKINDLDQALMDFNRTIEINPSDDSNYYGRANVYLERNELEKAFSDITRAINLDPNSPEVYRVRAKAHQRRGDVNACQADLKLASDLDAAQQESANLLQEQTYSQEKTKYFNKEMYSIFWFAVVSVFIFPVVGQISVIIPAHMLQKQIKSSNISIKTWRLNSALIISYLYLAFIAFWIIFYLQNTNR